VKFLNLVSLLVGIILLSSFVSADVTEVNVAIDTIVDSSSSIVSTSGELSGYDVYGFNCVDSLCSGSSGDFMTNPGSTSTSRYTITYPTVLTAPKYAFFYVKPGYLPYEATSDYAGGATGTVAAPDFSFNLAKRDSCSVAATVALSNVASGAVDVDVSYDAPFNHGGPLSFVPSALQSYYESPVSVSVSLTKAGTLIASGSSLDDVDFSGSDTKKISFSSLPDGAYDVSVSVSTSDSRCIASTATTLSDSFTSTGGPVTPPIDTTAPSDVTGLTLGVKSTSTINWNWVNPTDSDFSFVKVFIDGIHVIDIGGTTYTASGLLPGSSHTITLQTVDVTGNVNTPGVSNTQITLTTADTTPPADVTGVSVNGLGMNAFTLNWVNPTDTDFSHVLFFVDGVQVSSVSGISTSIGGLNPGQTYNVVLKSVDTTGNVNEPGVSLSVTTTGVPPTDTTPPGNVLNLGASAIGNKDLTIDWINPSDADFDSVLIYLNGNLVTTLSGTSGSTGSHTLTGLSSDTTYTITLKTRDSSGNIGEPGVSISVTTDKSGSGSGNNDRNNNKRDKNILSDKAEKAFQTLELDLDNLNTEDSEILVISSQKDNEDNEGVSGKVWFFVLINFLVLLLVVVVVEFKR
jgi:hypothetical protein